MVTMARSMLPVVVAVCCLVTMILVKPSEQMPQLVGQPLSEEEFQVSLYSSNELMVIHKYAVFQWWVIFRFYLLWLICNSTIGTAVKGSGTQLQQALESAGLLEGDINGRDSEANTTGSQAGNAVSDAERLWPEGIVPYTITDDFSKTIIEKTIIIASRP